MATAPSSANNELLVSRTAAWRIFRDSLRMYVGRGKRYSVKQLSNGTGIRDRMIESFMAPTDSVDWRKPDIEELLTICSFIGPEFTTEILAPIQQAAFWLPEADDTPPGVLAADNAEDNAEITRRAVDGTFVGDEPVLSVVGKRMIQRGASLAALGHGMAA